MMMMMITKALMMTMLMISIEHQQLLPGEIINNQSPISQAFKSIRHIMDGHTGKAMIGPGFDKSIADSAM